MTTGTGQGPLKTVRLGLFAIVVTLVQSGCSVFGIRTTAEPGYQLLQQQGQFEIRQYQPYVIATTRVEADFKDAGSQAFRRLFKYISGENRAQQDIAMTAPVVATETASGEAETMAMTAPVTGEGDGKGWRFSFVLPATYTLQSAPAPLDDRIQLEQVPAHKVAVLRYSGSWGNDRFDEHAAALEQWLRQQQLAPASRPRLAAYDPPFALPFLRRNEVMIDIES